MSPATFVIAAGASIDIDLSKLETGQQIIAQLCVRLIAYPAPHNPSHSNA